MAEIIPVGACFLDITPSRVGRWHYRNGILRSAPARRAFPVLDDVS